MLGRVVAAVALLALVLGSAPIAQAQQIEVPEHLQPGRDGKADAKAWAEYLKQNSQYFTFNPQGGMAQGAVTLVESTNSRIPTGLPSRFQFDKYVSPMPFFEYHWGELNKTIASLEKSKRVDFEKISAFYDGVLKANRSKVGKPGSVNSIPEYNELTKVRFFTALTGSGNDDPQLRFLISTEEGLRAVDEIPPRVPVYVELAFADEDPEPGPRSVSIKVGSQTFEGTAEQVGEKLFRTTTPFLIVLEPDGGASP